MTDLHSISKNEVRRWEVQTGQSGDLGTGRELTTSNGLYLGFRAALISVVQHPTIWVFLEAPTELGFIGEWQLSEPHWGGGLNQDLHHFEYAKFSMSKRPGTYILLVQVLDGC